MPLLRNMPQLRVPRYGGDETTKLLTKDGDCTLLGRKVHRPRNKSKYLTGDRTVDVADEENEDDAIPVPENELFDVCSHLEPNSCFKNCWNFLKVCADVCDNFSDDLIDNQLIC